MVAAVVRTVEELKAAVNSGQRRIIVRGELAEKLNTALKLETASKYTIGLLAASLAAAPFTGGLSVGLAAPIASLTGLEIALIIAVAAIGISLVLAILKDYKKVSFKAKAREMEAELVLEK